ncbi:MAG: hypothetical protein JWP11_1223, partial [Frankiales bacterium]|nr:hypothetical protein [Frankiales bacterium]
MTTPADLRSPWAPTAEDPPLWGPPELDPPAAPPPTTPP